MLQAERHPVSRHVYGLRVLPPQLFLVVVALDLFRYREGRPGSLTPLHVPLLDSTLAAPFIMMPESESKTTDEPKTRSVRAIARAFF
jgi:hypothetical protein